MPIAPEYLHLVLPGPFPAYIYGRASHDPKKKGRSVSTQVHEGRSLCEKWGWPIVGVFDKDVDRSASRHAKQQRTDFEAMLEGIRAGACRIAVAWEASRYYRDLEAYVRLRNACQEGGVLLCYNGMVYDLSRREDIKATARDALDAEDEAEGIRDRNLRTHKKIIADGTPHGRTPYGYTRRYDPDTGDLVGQIPHPLQAKFVREIFERFAGGQSVFRIAQYLNTQPDAAQATGVPWRAVRIYGLLSMRVYIGERVHHGVVIPGKAKWEPLVDESTFFRVQTILQDPSRHRQHDTSAKHLLSRISFCGNHPDREQKALEALARLEQGEPVRLHQHDLLPILTKYKRHGGRGYKCDDYNDTAISAPTMEAYVEEGLLTWLQTPEASAAFRPDLSDARSKANLEQLERLSAQLDEARKTAAEFDRHGRPKLSIASLAALEARLQPLIERARSELDRASAQMSPLLRELIGRDDIEKAWSELHIEQQREVIRQTVTVRLHKTTQGARRLTPGRITLSFVDQPGFIGRFR
ncbi:recombinase family protein [Streptomyces sp. URMC 124]|uniref:recombinase family protein n=1 Tax=Streptomyces sp. URMC 124 TaxID=3423405 RepID=UPI003F1BCAE4